MTDNDHKFGDLIMTQGTSSYFQSDSDFKSRFSLLKDKIREFFNLKNINFLFGSGTSSGAIPTMDGLFNELKFDEEKEIAEKTEFERIVNKVGENLEATLEVMYSARTYYGGIQTDDKHVKELYNRLIHRIEKYIFNRIDTVQNFV